MPGGADLELGARVDPGFWCVAVHRHLSPSSGHVEDLLRRFHRRYRHAANQRQRQVKTPHPRATSSSVTVAPMNDLNDPQRMNIRGDDGGGGSRWSYALVVPMLCLAIFRSIWTRETEQEKSRLREDFERRTRDTRSELDLRYRSLVTESGSSLARLELKHEKLKQRLSGYREAFAAQSQLLASERRQLNSQREELQGERRALESVRRVGPLHDAVLAQEELALAGARASLRALESALEERQAVYCSLLVPRKRRHVLERDMLRRARSEVALGRMAVHDGLLDIFANDGHCAHVTNEDNRRNGKLMWVYVRHWHTLLELHKYQQVQQRLHTEDPLEPPSA